MSRVTTASWILTKSHRTFASVKQTPALKKAGPCTSSSSKQASSSRGDQGPDLRPRAALATRFRALAPPDRHEAMPPRDNFLEMRACDAATRWRRLLSRRVRWVAVFDAGAAPVPPRSVRRRSSGTSRRASLRHRSYAHTPPTCHPGVCPGRASRKERSRSARGSLCTACRLRGRARFAINDQVERTPPRTGN